MDMSTTRVLALCERGGVCMNDIILWRKAILENTSPFDGRKLRVFYCLWRILIIYIYYGTTPLCRSHFHIQICRFDKKRRSYIFMVSASSSSSFHYSGITTKVMYLVIILFVQYSCGLHCPTTSVVQLARSGQRFLVCKRLGDDSWFICGVGAAGSFVRTRFLVNWRRGPTARVSYFVLML